MKLFEHRQWAADAPGRFIDVGTHRLHVCCAGEGTPTVVFDSALAGSVLSWVFVQTEVAAFARTCSYDRAGMGWSDAGPMPRTLGRIVDELHRLLTLAEVRPPVVLVGHSYGGLVMQLYATRYRDDVAGMVLVDSAHAQDWAHVTESWLHTADIGFRWTSRSSSSGRFVK